MALISRFGLSGTEADAIFFTESSAPAGQPVLGTVRVDRNRQNSNLAEIKRMMATEATRLGANAIVNFRYGQRAHKWWQQVFTLKWDSESWFGEGDAVRFQ